MKTRISIALMLVAGVVLSCNKVSRTDLPAPQPEVTIRASIPDDATRVGAQYGFSWSWEATDRLTVIGEETQVFNIKKGFSAKFAEFTGRPVSGESFTILYPGVDANTADWSNQSQQGNGGTAHLRYTSALEGVDAYESFTFSPAWAAAHGGTEAEIRDEHMQRRKQMHRVVDLIQLREKHVEETGIGRDRPRQRGGIDQKDHAGERHGDQIALYHAAGIRLTFGQKREIKHRFFSLE